MMYDTIKNFQTQFEYEPEVQNSDALGDFGKFVIAGMGGSNLVADLLRIRDPYVDIVVHRDYGLPPSSDSDLRSRIFIANSYSGNTEEVIDALNQALEKGLMSAVIATGGGLIEIAKKRGLPYVQMPAVNIQPRSALGYNLRAVLKVMGRENLLEETKSLRTALNPSNFEMPGRELAKKLEGRVPVVYASEKNRGIAYNWKIKLNETGKIPAYHNVFPELNHNEMTGFDRKGQTGGLSEKFYFLFLYDSEDHPHIRKRMEITRKLFQDRDFPVEILELKGENVWHKIFSSLIFADWTSYYLGESYGVETEQVPMVEEFKKLIS